MQDPWVINGLVIYEQDRGKLILLKQHIDAALLYA